MGARREPDFSLRKAKTIPPKKGSKSEVPLQKWKIAKISEERKIPQLTPHLSFKKE